MKKREQREVYRVLCSEAEAPLCFACGCGEYDGGSCEDGFYSCRHPRDAVRDRVEDEPLEPGADCRGFQPERASLETLAECASVTLRGGHWWTEDGELVAHFPKGHPERGGTCADRKEPR